MIGSEISGIGIALPTHELTNSDLCRSLDVSEEWIASRTGIETRRIASPDESSSTLGIAAAFAAIADTGTSVDDIDLVIAATVTPDYTFPATACAIQAALGISAPAFDLNAGCSGFLFALAQAEATVRAGRAHCIVVVGTDVLSRLTDHSDRKTAILFGDGAGAIIVRRTEAAPRLGPFELHSDGRRPELLFVDPETSLIRMRGREVYRAAVDAMARSIKDVLRSRGLRTSDVDLLVAHQANQRILEAVARKADIEPTLAYSNIARRGNTSAASIPLALFEARAEGRVAQDDLVVLAAFGAGFSWGAGLLRWGRADVRRKDVPVREAASA